MDQKFESYHAHLYYPIEDIPKAEALLEKVRSNFDLEIGRVWDKPVGPHPIGSCQISVTNEAFAEFIPWLMREREGMDVFVHGLSGDDLADHTEHVMWLGKSYKLNTEMFVK